MDSEFELLKAEGILGFYKSCEVTMIVLHNKKLQKTYNFYTLVTFEERPYTGAKERFLSGKSIAKDLSIGIFRYHLTLDEVTEAYEYLLQYQIWKHKEKEIHLNNLNREKKRFIKCDATTSVPLNSILKNNFYNGSYIIEFFDMEKSFLNGILESKTLEKISNHVKSNLPIDLQFMNDRIGNIIFQFPSNLMEIQCTSTEDWDGFNIKLVTDERIKTKDHYALIISDNFDETTSSFNLTSGLTQEEFTVVSGNSDSLNTIQVIDTRNQLILSSQTLNFIKHIGLKMDISPQYAEPRTIIRGADTLIERIEVVAQNHIGNQKALSSIDWIQKRKYKNEKDALAKRLEFVQYGKSGSERTKALQDIRILINRHGREGVYLWDPYLTYEDLIDTLYYCQYKGVGMKAITSFDKKRMRVYRHRIKSPVQDLTICDWCDI